MPATPRPRRSVLYIPGSNPRALEKSRNRASGGAGLGLAVVRSLVEAHGGTIDIAAAPAGGTRVNVALPVFRLA